MINALLLSSAVAVIALQAIIKKYYNGITSDKGAFVFNAVFSIAACAFFVVFSGFDLHFTLELLPYSLLFAVGYGGAIVAAFLAIKYGSLSLSSLVLSYSLLVPTAYGLMFLDEKLSVFLIIGLVLLSISLFLINSKKGDGKITLVWVIWAAASFVCNGACATVQLVQQRNFDGGYKSEFMIVALLVVAVILIVISAFADKGDIKFSLKKGWWLMALCGIANAAANLFIMLLNVRMKASIMYPVVSAGGIILTWVVSRFLYREKLSAKQNLALILGSIAVVFMNI